MKEFEIKATSPVYKTNEEGDPIFEEGKKVVLEVREQTVKTNMPDTFEEARSLWGEDMTMQMAQAMVKVRLQALMRNGIENGASEEEISRNVNEWKPGNKTVIKKDPLAAMMEYLKEIENADPEKAKALRAQLKKMATGQ